MKDRFSVLVVDDESDVRTIVGLNLRLAGMDFGEAANGVEALRMLRSGEWDGCILDLTMPGLSGVEVLEHLSGDGTLERTGVIVLSANGAPASAVAAMQKGAHTYLSKPFSPPAVAQTMRELLGLSPSERATRREQMIERAGNLDRLGVSTV